MAAQQFPGVLPTGLIRGIYPAAREDHHARSKVHGADPVLDKRLKPGGGVAEQNHAGSKAWLGHWSVGAWEIGHHAILAGALWGLVCVLRRGDGAQSGPRIVFPFVAGPGVRA
ncbi:hypothetical protein GCM10010052_34980 [Paenarthrobacter histidinolovorans]|nr:hypothetical protein GCM10010052_34980 [Paenarthrobacter histidinolovorans]